MYFNRVIFWYVCISIKWLFKKEKGGKKIGRLRVSSDGRDNFPVWVRCDVGWETMMDLQ